MSQATSPSAGRRYGLARVCRVWQLPRSTVYHRRKQAEMPTQPKPAPRRRNGPEETLVVFRERQQRKMLKHDYCLSNAPFQTPLREFARVINAEHRIEECIKRAKSEAGLAQYEVRTWEGWHHHQTLARIGRRQLLAGVSHASAAGCAGEAAI